MCVVGSRHEVAITQFSILASLDNKYHSCKRILFWKFFSISYNESLHKESKICPVPNICPGYLNKV